jgi:hypothetical protein
MPPICQWSRMIFGDHFMLLVLCSLDLASLPTTRSGRSAQRSDGSKDQRSNLVAFPDPTLACPIWIKNTPRVNVHKANPNRKLSLAVILSFTSWLFSAQLCSTNVPLFHALADTSRLVLFRVCLDPEEFAVCHVRRILLALVVDNHVIWFISWCPSSIV